MLKVRLADAVRICYTAELMNTINAEEKLVHILNEMSEYLNVLQMKKITQLIIIRNLL